MTVFFEANEDGSPVWLPQFNSDKQLEVDLITNFGESCGYYTLGPFSSKWGFCVDCEHVSQLINILECAGFVVKDVRSAWPHRGKNWWKTVEELHNVVLL
jgi:hypothetical protein